MMAKKLTGKIAVITGGNSGIGLATAKLFAEEGAFVFITGRRQEELEKAVKEIGKNAIGVQGDISKMADLDRLYATVKQKKGRIDILFANAGWGEFVPIEKVTEEHYNKTFDVNVKGTLFTVQKALPLLVDGASIILNASITSRQGTAAFCVYSASKAAVRSLARCLTSDLKSRRIRVNALSPGPTVTPGFETLAKKDDGIRQFQANAGNFIPIGRMGTSDEIAKAALFLAGDDSSFITGIELFVDGGMVQV